MEGPSWTPIEGQTPRRFTSRHQRNPLEPRAPRAKINADGEVVPQRPQHELGDGALACPDAMVLAELVEDEALEPAMAVEQHLAHLAAQGAVGRLVAPRLAL